MSELNIDDIFKDILGVSAKKEAEIDLSKLDETNALLINEEVEQSLYDASTSMVVSSVIEYPFLYIYPYKYECETERLVEITEEDKSADEEKITVMAPFNGNVTKVGRFRIDLKNIYKLLQFKKYEMFLVTSPDTKMKLGIENLLNTLVEE